MENEISSDILEKLGAVRVGLYAKYNKDTDIETFYKNMHMASSVISTFYNDAMTHVFDAPGYSMVVSGFESGSLLNFVSPEQKDGSKFDDKKFSLLSNWFFSILNFLSISGEKNIEDWRAVANDLNEIAADAYGESVAEMIKVDERFVLQQSSKICKKIGFGKINDFNLYVSLMGNVKRLEVRQAVNDSYVDEVLAEPGELIFDRDAILFVKKPDVSGDSRWEVYWERKRIVVKIVHYDWLARVRNLGIEFGSKSYLNVHLKVYRIKSLSGKLIEKYVVEEVFGGNYEEE